MQFWLPIWVIFLLDRGLSMNQIIIADIVWNLTVIILEIPMGVLGDKIGRKRTYFLGSLFNVLTFFLMTLISSFTLLIVCWISWSIMNAITSGTDIAYVYELIKETGNIERSTHIFGYFTSIASFAFIISHFTAGFLYAINSNLPILINAGFSLFASLIILKLPEPQKKEQFYSSRIGRKIVKTIKKPFELLVMVTLAFLVMYSYTTTLIFQPFLLELGLNVKQFGYVYMSYTVLGVFGGLITGNMVDKFGKLKIILFGMITLVASITLVGTINGLFSIIGLVLIKFTFYLAESPLKVIINDRMENVHRATIFSFINMISSLFMIGSRPLVGLLSDSYSHKFAFLVWALVGVLFIVISLPFLIKFRKEIETNIDNTWL